MDDGGKMILFGIFAVLGVYLLLSLLPYLVAGLACIGAWYLYQQSQK